MTDRTYYTLTIYLVVIWERLFSKKLSWEKKVIIHENNSFDARYLDGDLVLCHKHLIVPMDLQ